MEYLLAMSSDEQARVLFRHMQDEQVLPLEPVEFQRQGGPIELAASVEALAALEKTMDTVPSVAELIGRQVSHRSRGRKQVGCQGGFNRLNLVLRLAWELRRKGNMTDNCFQ